MKKDCELCHPDQRQCESCLPIPDEFSEYINYPVLNPVQSQAYNNLDKECLICTSSTATGKTLIFEMKMIRWLRDKNPRDIGFVLEPLKMLANEKVEEWNERYPDLDIIELTGDTKDKIIEKSDETGGRNEKLANELSKHDIIVTSYEMFSSLTLGNVSRILPKVSLFCVDEIHMLGDNSRGQELEGALIRYFRNYNSPRCEFLGLSATFENNEDLEDFFKNFGYEPKTIKSEWTPVKREFGGIYTHRRADDRNELMANQTIDLLKEYNKILTVVFSRKATEDIAKRINMSKGKIAEFHHAGVERKNRRVKEKKFKENDRTKVLVATPTVASGVNLPADAIVLNTDFFDGLINQNRILARMTIEQIVGRAGRPQFCDEAKVIFTVRGNLKNELKRELNSNLRVDGTLFDNLDLVLLEELDKRSGSDIDEIEEWLDLSFSEITTPYHRNVDEDIDELIERNFIEENDGYIKNKSKGRACAKAMIDPDKLDFVLSILQEFEDEEKSTSLLIEMVKKFYNSNLTARIDNVRSRFKDYINYKWMMDGSTFAWRKSPPNYDFQREIRDEFKRINFALDVFGKSSELIGAIAEMMPFQFYRLKEKLKEAGVDQVGQKRLLALWFNEIRPDNLSEPPRDLRLPKSLDKMVMLSPIDETEREVVSWQSDGVDKIYPFTKWDRDRKKIQELGIFEDISVDEPSDEIEQKSGEQVKIDDFFG